MLSSRERFLIRITVSIYTNTLNIQLVPTSPHQAFHNREKLGGGVYYYCQLHEGSSTSRWMGFRGRVDLRGRGYGVSTREVSCAD